MMTQKILDWAKDRGILDHGDSKTQSLKLMEEAGELAAGIIKSNDNEVIDAIGDCVVVLTILAELYSIENDLVVNINDCTKLAYDQISKRKGKMSNGSFIKEK